MAAAQDRDVSMTEWPPTLDGMRAEERQRLAAVPAELVEMLGERLFDDAHENCDSEGCTGGGLPYYEEYARILLADLLPKHERMVREQVAREAGTNTERESHQA